MRKVVIKISDKDFKDIHKRTEHDTLTLGLTLIEAVQKGFTLPKRSNYLIDADEWLSTFNNDSATECFTAIQKLKKRTGRI